MAFVVCSSATTKVSSLDEFNNGEAYYEVGSETLCEDCINDCKRIMDVDEYTYDDYFEEEYAVCLFAESGIFRF